MLFVLRSITVGKHALAPGDDTPEPLGGRIQFAGLVIVAAEVQPISHAKVVQKQAAFGSLFAAADVEERQDMAEFRRLHRFIHIGWGFVTEQRMVFDRV